MNIGNWFIDETVQIKTVYAFGYNEGCSSPCKE